MKTKITCLLFILSLASCTNKENSFYGPCLTKDAKEVMENSAVLCGRIKFSEERYDDYSIGFVVSESDNPNQSNSYLFTTTEVDANNEYSIKVYPLAQDTKYYYRAYVYNKNIYQYGEIKQLKTKPLPFSIEAVDLGLSVKWASFDVGASAPGELGAKFAWGELSEKDEYTWFNYKWGYSYWNESHTGMIYVFHKYGGTLTHDNGYARLQNAPDDGKRSLDLIDDAAYAIWGHGWHIPTKENCEELVKQCSFSHDEVGGNLGVKVTGPNGKSIFFPAPPEYYDGNQYWSSDLHHSHMGEEIDEAVTLFPFEETYEGYSRVQIYSQERARGLYIRPVL